MYGLWHDRENTDEQRVAPSVTDPLPVAPDASPYSTPTLRTHATPGSYCVVTSQPSSVTMMVCSFWLTRQPSSSFNTG